MRTMNAVMHHNYYACLETPSDTFVCVNCGETRWFYECVEWDECPEDRCKACLHEGHCCDCSSFPPHEGEEEEEGKREEEGEWNEAHGAWVYGSEYSSAFDQPYPAAAWRSVEKALEEHPSWWERGDRIKVGEYSNYITPRDIAYVDVILTLDQEGWVRILSCTPEWDQQERYDIDLSKEEWLPVMETMGPHPYPLHFRPEYKVDPESGLKAYDPMGLLWRSIDGHDLRRAEHSGKPRLVPLPPDTWWQEAKEQIEFALTAYVYPPVREGETVLLTERTALWRKGEPYTVRYEMEFLNGTWSPLLVIQAQRRCFLCYTYDVDYFPLSLHEF